MHNLLITQQVDVTWAAHRAIDRCRLFVRNLPYAAASLLSGCATFVEPRASQSRYKPCGRCPKKKKKKYGVLRIVLYTCTLCKGPLLRKGRVAWYVTRYFEE